MLFNSPKDKNVFLIMYTFHTNKILVSEKVLLTDIKNLSLLFPFYSIK